MPVVGVFAKTQIRDHQKIRRDSPGVPNRLLNDSVIAQGGRATRVFMLGDTEEQDCRQAQVGRFSHRVAEPVERELVLARHRRDFAPKILAVIDEERINQVGDGEMRLGDQGAKPRMTAKAPWSMKGITGCGLKRHHAVPRQRRREWLGSSGFSRAIDRITARRAIGGWHRD